MLDRPQTLIPDLQLEALSLASPDGRPLLRSASICFTPGITALTGPNGSGKSTLLRAIAMLHPIESGSIVFGRLQGRHDRSAFLAQIVFMPQNFPHYPSMTGQEFLQYSLLMRGSSRSQARSIAAEWLDRLGLQSVAKALCGTYSQGMRQRLGFAYAVQLDVPLYLLDEPFAGVDPEWRAVMQDLLLQICSDRIVIVTTHHADELISRGADRLDIIQGRLEATCQVAS